MAVAAAHQPSPVPVRSITPRFDEGISPLGRVGFIALANGYTSEHEVAAMLPKGLVLYVSRVPNENVVTMSSLKAMESGMVATAALIVPDEKLDVMIYGCTSGTVAMGEDKVTALIQEVRPGVAVTTPITGAFEAFKTLGKRRVTLLTPYITEVTSAMRDYMEKNGLRIVDAANFNVNTSSDMMRVAPEAIAEAAIRLDHPESEATFISCTALRTRTIIETVEKATGKPCVTSNQALAWHAAKLAGCDVRPSGFGSLFQH
jgi:maleate isomerase